MIANGWIVGCVQTIVVTDINYTGYSDIDYVCYSGIDYAHYSDIDYAPHSNPVQKIYIAMLFKVYRENALRTLITYLKDLVIMSL